MFVCFKMLFAQKLIIIFTTSMIKKKIASEFFLVPVKAFVLSHINLSL
jgi:hypothetical protein